MTKEQAQELWNIIMLSNKDAFYAGVTVSLNNLDSVALNRGKTQQQESLNASKYLLTKYTGHEVE